MKSSRINSIDLNSVVCETINSPFSSLFISNDRWKLAREEEACMHVCLGRIESIPIVIALTVK